MNSVKNFNTSVRIAILRHGPTLWNQEKRYQGHTDIPLSPEGEMIVKKWKLPQELTSYRIISSPLMRAKATARILTGKEPETEKRIIEMFLGNWEGLKSGEIKARYGKDIFAEDYAGLDFKPHGGENLRETQERLKLWLEEVFKKKEPVLAVSHKGTMTALYALATGWDVTKAPPDKIDWQKLHYFKLLGPNQLEVEKLNIVL